MPAARPRPHHNLPPRKGLGLRRILAQEADGHGEGRGLQMLDEHAQVGDSAGERAAVCGKSKRWNGVAVVKSINMSSVRDSPRLGRLG